MTAQAKRDIRRKLKILEHAEKIGNVRETCRYYGIYIARLVTPEYTNSIKMVLLK